MIVTMATWEVNTEELSQNNSLANTPLLHLLCREMIKTQLIGQFQTVIRFWQLMTSTKADVFLTVFKLLSKPSLFITLYSLYPHRSNSEVTYLGSAP